MGVVRHKSEHIWKGNQQLRLPLICLLILVTPQQNPWKCQPTWCK